MAHSLVRIGIALAITAQAVTGQFNDNPFASEQTPIPANRGGGGFFKDNPFSNGGGRDEMPGTAPPAAGGISSTSNGIPPTAGGGGGGNPGGSPSTGGSGANPGLSRSPLPAQCPDIFPSEEEILEDKPGCPATRALEPLEIEDLSFEQAPTCPDRKYSSPPGDRDAGHRETTSDRSRGPRRWETLPEPRRCHIHGAMLHARRW